MVTINNLPLSNWGLRSIKWDNNLSIKGLFDMPKRKGETERDWGTSIEAFLEAQDIIFEGRNIELRAITDTRANIVSFGSYLKNNGQLTLGTDYGNFTVLLKDEMRVEKSGHLFIVEAKLWQEEVSFMAPGTGSGGAGYLIDGYNLLMDFGLIPLKKSDYLNEAKRIEVDTTDFYTLTQYREAKELKMDCVLKGDSKTDFWNKLNRFYGLLASSGYRTIHFPDGFSFNCYCKDGVDCKSVYYSGVVIAELSLKLREVQA